VNATQVTIVEYEETREADGTTAVRCLFVVAPESADRVTAERLQTAEYRSVSNASGSRTQVRTVFIGDDREPRASPCGTACIAAFAVGAVVFVVLVVVAAACLTAHLMAKKQETAANNVIVVESGDAARDTICVVDDAEKDTTSLP